MYSIEMEVGNGLGKIPKPSNVKEESTISFHDVSYNLEETQGCCGCLKKKTSKKILSNVNGAMKRGINAIIGPTGSGKTSLLDILANRKNLKWLQGKVLLNGKKLTKSFKYINGYVVQSDVLMGTLTVRECLWFSANLRLSVDTRLCVKSERINELLEQLGLTKCSDIRIGNEYIRGISGGERKRTTIGVELITQPDVLYLDEPTSGLDSATAYSIMHLLKQLGNNGQTIVLSIHQPKFNIFRMFDSLTILSHGQCIYHGLASDALGYFNGIGYPCEANNNPADFFLDVIHGLVGTELPNGSNQEIESGSGRKHDNEIAIANNLHEKYIKSNIFQECKTKLDLILENSKTKHKKDKTAAAACPTPFWFQFRHLVKRDFTNIVRNPQGLIGNLIVNILISVIFGLIYLNMNESPIQGTQNRFGLLFFVTTNLLFGSINVIELLMKSRALFIHEYVSGYYQIISYFLAKLFADIVPMRTIAPLSYALITYWMAGLSGNVSNFFVFLLISILTGYAAVGVGVFFSATFTTFAVASLLMVLVFIFSIVFSGVLVNISTIGAWLSWVQYLSIARYSIVGLCVNEFTGKNFTQCFANTDLETIAGFIGGPSFSVTTNNISETCISISGEKFLKSELSVMPPVTYGTSWILWQNAVALICIASGMYVLTYVQLVRMKKYS